MSAEIVPTVKFSDETLGALVDGKSVEALFASYDQEIEDISSFGSGFTLATKESLIGIPLVVVQWRFNTGAYGEDFVSAEIVTSRGDKVVVNDGSTGICAQLKAVTAARVADNRVVTHGGVRALGGLTKTSYFYNETTKQSVTRLPEGASVGKDGWGPASTYYLA